MRLNLNGYNGRQFLLISILSIQFLFILIIRDSNLFFQSIKGMRLLVCGIELLFVFACFFICKPIINIYFAKNSLTAKLFVAWLIWSSLAMVFSQHQIIALTRHAEWLCHCLFSFALWRCFCDYPKLVSWVCFFIVLGFIFTGFCFLVFWHQLTNLTDPYNYPWAMQLPHFNHIRHFGHYILTALIFTAYPLLDGKTTLIKICVSCFGMLFCWAFLFWSGGRGVLLSALASFIIIIWILNKQQQRLVTVLFIATAIVGAWLSTHYEVSSGGMGLFHSAERTATSPNIDRLSSGRITIWTRVFQDLRHNVWFGAGPDGYIYISSHYNSTISHPHNMIIQSYVEWGIVGCAVFIILLFQLIRKIYANIQTEQNQKYKGARIVALWLILAYTIHGMTSGTYYFALPLMLLACSFAIGLLPVTDIQCEFKKN